MDADLLLVGGNIVTLNASSQIAQAVAIRGSRIVDVGDTSDLSARINPAARRIDLGGRTVLPGFYDAHPHMDREGLRKFGGLPLVNIRSIEEILVIVRKAARQAQPGEWIVLMPMGKPPHDYINHPERLKEGRFPNRYDLDEVAPDNPVYIRAVWGWWSRPPFPAIANSKAIELAKVGCHTRDPYNIEIVRDRRGEPTGLFLERNRVSLLEFTLFRCIPRFTYSDHLNSVIEGSRAYSQLGTTSGYEGHGLTPTLIRAYREADERGDLTVRMCAPVSVPTAALSRSQITDLLTNWAATAGGKGMSSGGAFSVSGITLDYGDPNIARTIARDYPYAQWASFFSQCLTEQEFVDLGILAAGLGLRINVVLASAPPYHSFERALSMLEQINHEVKIRDLRCVGFHLIHATKEQLHRIRELGMAVTTTPSFFFAQSGALGFDKLGSDAMPIRQVLDAGIPVGFGSDNVPPSMLFTCWEALARWDAVDSRHVGESHLTREEVLRICVQTPHYITWQEGTRGVVAPGAAADLVAIDGDPLTCDLDLIPQLKTELTLLDGTITFESADLSRGGSGSA